MTYFLFEGGTSWKPVLTDELSDKVLSPLKPPHLSNNSQLPDVTHDDDC